MPRVIWSDHENVWELQINKNEDGEVIQLKGIWKIIEHFTQIWANHFENLYVINDFPRKFELPKKKKTVENVEFLTKLSWKK